MNDPDGGGPACGGTNYQTTMLLAPIYHTQPDIIDSHMYPHVENAGPGDTQVQQIAALDFSDLAHFLGVVNPSALVMIGETHVGPPVMGVGTGGTQCLGTLYPSTAAASTVVGFNQSQLAGHSIVFRPWMELQDPSGVCYPYPAYQNVNLNWGGPYTPTRY
jgi:hypothetical protein